MGQLPASPGLPILDWFYPYVTKESAMETKQFTRRSFIGATGAVALAGNCPVCIAIVSEGCTAACDAGMAAMAMMVR